MRTEPDMFCAFDAELAMVFAFPSLEISFFKIAHLEQKKARA